MLVQVLLSQSHRFRALVLLGRFLDMGAWAVDLVTINFVVIFVICSFVCWFFFGFFGLFSHLLLFDSLLRELFTSVNLNFR